MIILVGDIGGIHSRIAYYEFDTSRLKFLVEEIYPSVQYTDWTGESSSHQIASSATVEDLRHLEGLTRLAKATSHRNSSPATPQAYNRWAREFQTTCP
jgi:glucokinase